MKTVFIIAVLCVVPCAFQDDWDYGAWYVEFDQLDDGLGLNPDQPKNDEVEQPLENDEHDEFNPETYDSDDNYRDYEIEDNRDDVKNKLEKEDEPQFAWAPPDDDNHESAVHDFDAVQKLIEDHKLTEDEIDKLMAFDENNSKELSETDNQNVDAIPEIVLDKDVVDAAVKDPEVSHLTDAKNDHKSEEAQETADQSKSDVVKEDEGLELVIEDKMDETHKLIEDISNLYVSNEAHYDDTEDEPAEIDAQPNLQDIFNETRRILEDMNTNFDENSKEVEQNVGLPIADIQDDMKNIMDETRQILEKSESDVDTNKQVDDFQPIPVVEGDLKVNLNDSLQIVEEINSQLEETKKKEDVEQNKEEPTLELGEDENTVAKEYEDVNEDLHKLFETWEKLSRDTDEQVNQDLENARIDKDGLIDGEGLNPDYSNLGDDVKQNFDYEGEASILAFRDAYYESLRDKDYSDLINDFDDDVDKKDISSESGKNNVDEIAKESKPYVNDALAADYSDHNQQNTEIKSDDSEPKVKEVEHAETTQQKKIEETTTTEVNKPIQATKDVEDLTSSELDELSKQFVVLHESEMKMAHDETPIHITLTADEPVVITSPNYPNSYPTDQTVVDWILEGLGTGIEVNVTDLAINSAQGHFLMIKPGQTDDSGDSGLVFAYRLNSERRYRFRDVNKMFIRFNPLGGMAFSRGFKLSARIIEPPADETTQDLPEPEFLIPEPQHTASLLLAGVNSTSFLEVKEEFQRLLADMATMYINANNIDPGMNSTNVVTQITRSYVCNVNWPGFESCVEVTFGVPLVYEDEEVPTRLNESELLEMWYGYASRDPFAARLAQMGISDFTVPNEDKLMTVWMVIGVGVVVAASMLAFVLWRYSCMENYTRMQEFSDTDSIHDKKRGLDMYPTPHQTLPPLYTENDYKWADRTFDDSTRVDMGGFANNSFTRDELSSESEEDMVVSRDRFTTDV